MNIGHNKKQLAGLIVILSAVTILVVLKPKIEKVEFLVSEPLGKRGIGVTYCIPDNIDLLNLDWFLTWGVSTGYLSDPRYVPMLAGNGQRLEDNINALPSDWSKDLMVFSEPDILGTGRIEPEDAAMIYLDVKERFPNAQLIVGGLAFGDSPWTAAFLSNLNPIDHPDYWHVHGYPWVDLKTEVTDRWEHLYNLVQKPIWITEFGVPSADANLLSELLLYMETQPWIERYAMFPCRIVGDEDWFPSTWSVDMAPINWDYTISPIGEMYRDFEVHKINFPLVVN